MGISIGNFVFRIGYGGKEDAHQQSQLDLRD